jgi:gas vesicle protein
LYEGFDEYNMEEGMRKITRASAIVVALLTAAALTAVGEEEGVGEQIKEGAKKTGEAIKDTAKAVGKETKAAAKAVGRTAKDTAKTISEKTKEAWRDTKAYASEDRPTYHKGAGQRLNDLESEITELKSRRSEAADPEAFDRQLDALSQQQATAEGELTRVKEAAGTEDYSAARKQFDTTIDEMEDGIAQARKQLRD